MKEFDIVVLQIDLPEHGLKAWDIGSIVHKYSEEKAVEVEFVTGEGHTLGVITLGYQDLRLMGDHEILHVRTIRTAWIIDYDVFLVSFPQITTNNQYSIDFIIR